jgi:hypothetical protein
MNGVKILRETRDSVTVSRGDWTPAGAERSCALQPPMPYAAFVMAVRRRPFAPGQWTGRLDFVQLAKRTATLRASPPRE